MATVNDILINLTTTADINGTSVYIPISNIPAPVIKAVDDTSIKSIGINMGSGSYLFTAVVGNHSYKAYEGDPGSEIVSWGGSNGVWIGDEQMAYYASSADLASVQADVTSLESATASLNTELTKKATLTGTNTFSGANTFSGGVTVTGSNMQIYSAVNLHDKAVCDDNPVAGTSLVNRNTLYEALTGVTMTGLYASLTGTNTFPARQTFTGGITISGANSYLWSPLNLKTYAFCDVPTLSTSVTNKGYVDSEISTQLGAFSTSGYQESQNVIRLIPNGTQQTGKVYNTFADALAYASLSASLTSQYTILICGNGINATEISATALADYVHIKGLGSNIRLDIYNATLVVNEIGNSIIENVTLVETKGSAGQTFENIVFKNVNFEEINSTTVFTTCKFTGMCYFATNTNNTYQFQNSYGTIETDEHTVVVAGTSKVNILSPDKISINDITLQDDGTQFYIDSGLKIDQGATIGGETNISGRLNVTGDAKFVSNTITLSASTITLSGTTISTTGNIASPKITTPSIYSNMTLTGFDAVGADSKSITIAGITDGFGVDTNNKIMLEPDAWVNVTIGTVIYAIPLYTPRT